MKESAVGTDDANARTRREVRSCDRPDRIVDFKPSAAIDYRAVQSEHPADVTFGAPIEMPIGVRGSIAGEDHSATRHTGDGESCEDQRLVLPCETRSKPGNCGDAHCRGG